MSCRTQYIYQDWEYVVVVVLLLLLLLVWSLTFQVNCGFNLVRILVIELIIFCIFLPPFLHLSGNCAVSVHFCIVAFTCIHLATGPDWQACTVNQLNWMELYTHHIQEQMISLRNFSSTIIILLTCILDVISYFPFLFIFICCLPFAYFPYVLLLSLSMVFWLLCQNIYNKELKYLLLF
jgi:hypothetical protein